MNRFYPLLALLCLHLTPHAYTQSNKWHIGPMMNFQSFRNTSVKNDLPVREGEDNILNNLTYWTNLWNFGISVERRLPNKRWFVASGLCWTRMDFCTGVAGNADHNYYLYVLTSQNDRQVAYATTDVITEYREYLTIPLSVQYDFTQFKERGAFYVKGAINSSIALDKTRNEIHMDPDTENKYFGIQKSLFMDATVSIGFRVGKLRCPNARFEGGITLPLTNNIANRRLTPGVNVTGIFYFPTSRK